MGATPGALHFHDLRAEAACRLYEHSGRDVLRVMRCLDHRSLAETQVYLERLMGETETETAAIMAQLEADRMQVAHLSMDTLQQAPPAAATDHTQDHSDRLPGQTCPKTLTDFPNI